jgi:predicted 2-oxoglutarate/Fe(II)-dependent dioxygenase YbiX
MNIDAGQITSCGGADFFVVAREAGHTDLNLPVWTCTEPGGISYHEKLAAVTERKDVRGVPGVFHLLNVLSDEECDRFVQISEALGYHGDAPVSLPRRIRHNNNFNWIVDESVDGPIWDRCRRFFRVSEFDGQRPLGLNARFRFYRYVAGDFFNPHTDGAWPGSRVINGQLVADAYGDRLSQLTALIFLSDGYEGGHTLFHMGPTSIVPVHTPKGAILCFPHGTHPQHCVHAGEEVTAGRKYIVRTDVLYG